VEILGVEGIAIAIDAVIGILGIAIGEVGHEGRRAGVSRVRIVIGDGLAIAHVAASCATEAGGLGQGSRIEHPVVGVGARVRGAVVLVTDDHDGQIGLGTEEVEVLRVDVVRRVERHPEGLQGVLRDSIILGKFWAKACCLGSMEGELSTTNRMSTARSGATRTENVVQPLELLLWPPEPPKGPLPGFPPPEPPAPASVTSPTSMACLLQPMLRKTTRASKTREVWVMIIASDRVGVGRWAEVTIFRALACNLPPGSALPDGESVFR